MSSKLTNETGAHGVDVFACATKRFHFERAALDFTYFKACIDTRVGCALLSTASHLFGVLRLGVLWHEVAIHAGEELGWSSVFADVGHLVGDGRSGVCHMRVERLRLHDSAVLGCCVVAAFVDWHREPGGGGGEWPGGRAQDQSAGAHDRTC